MKFLPVITIVFFIAFITALSFLVIEENNHFKTRVRLNSYEIKLFECAYSLEKANKTRPKPVSR